MRSPQNKLLYTYLFWHGDFHEKVSERVDS